MAPTRRFERPTCPLGGGCSIQLSYVGTARDSRRGCVREQARFAGKHIKTRGPDVKKPGNPGLLTTRYMKGKSVFLRDFQIFAVRGRGDHTWKVCRKPPGFIRG